MKKVLTTFCIATLGALALTSFQASAQYYPPKRIYYYSQPMAYKYYASPVVGYGPVFGYYYSDDPVKRFWARQERYSQY